MDLTEAESALLGFLRAAGGAPFHCTIATVDGMVVFTLAADGVCVMGQGDSFEAAVLNTYQVPPAPASDPAPQAPRSAAEIRRAGLRLVGATDT